jgi:hypothetical protein
VDRNHIYRKPLHELDLTGLTELCGNVAHNLSANSRQSDIAHSLRVEYVRLHLDRSLDGGKSEAEESLRQRMLEFLAGVPAWILSGV